MSGFVYFIECGGRVKIGYSTNPKRRLATIQTSAPFPCTILATLVGTKDDEQRLHAAFGALRRTGEWFERSGDLDGLLREAAKGNLTAATEALCRVEVPDAPLPEPGAFAPVFALLGGIDGVSKAIGVPYGTANAMKRRDSIGTDHWGKLVAALKGAGSALSMDDVLLMSLATSRRSKVKPSQEAAA